MDFVHLSLLPSLERSTLTSTLLCDPLPHPQNLEAACLSQNSAPLRVSHPLLHVPVSNLAVLNLVTSLLSNGEKRHNKEGEGAENEHICSSSIVLGGVPGAKLRR